MSTWRVVVGLRSVPTDYDLEVEADDEDDARDKALQAASDLLSEEIWDLGVISVTGAVP